MFRNFTDYLIVVKVISEGNTFRDRLVLLISILYSIAEYINNKRRHLNRYLSYYLWKDCLIRNKSGIFYCRAGTNDALTASISHDVKLQPYFRQIR